MGDVVKRDVRQEIADEFKASYANGLATGLTTALDADDPIHRVSLFTLDPLSKWLDDAWTKGMREGRRQRRDDVRAYLSSTGGAS